VRRTPPISGLGPARRAVRFVREPLDFLDELRGEESGLIHARLAVGPSLWFVTDPGLIQQVLVHDDKRYRRPDIQSTRTTRLTENGLIESDGELWRDQRDRLQPLFGPDRISEYATAIGEETEALLRSWSDGEEIDLLEEMTALTVRIIARALFSRELTDEEGKRFVRANEVIGAEFEVSPATLVRQFAPTSASQQYQKAIAELHEWADGIIAERRRVADPPQDLITTLLQAERDPDVELPPNQVRDEVLTFLFAGHETTALALTYALWFVSQDSEITEEVRTETRTVLDTDQAVPTWGDLGKLTATERVVREALRLRPPSWGVFRQARATSRLGGTRVERGDYLVLPQWTVHRDARHFDRPETFDPGRWADRQASETTAYFPFGGGPHACIGGQLALTEAQIVLAALLSEFRFDTGTKSLGELRPAGVLQPAGDCSVTVRGSI
jgi:cytochrome P450